MRTVPVNHSAGPLPDGREPLRLIFIPLSFALWAVAGIVSLIKRVP